MALNSLYSSGWFALGFAAMKTGDVQRALDAFTRAIQLDPENWEAWGNIAYLHLIRKKKKESFIAYTQAVKFMRDSWKLWENYGLVAVEVGKIVQALDAARRVLDVTNYKITGVRLLDKITQYLEESSSNTHSAVSDGDYCANKNLIDSCIYSVDKLANSEPNEGMSPEKWQMVKLLGNILDEISRRNPIADIWGLCARCHRMNGDLIMCSVALSKQIRSYKGSDMWKDGDRYRRFAHSLWELCKIYITLFSSTGGHEQLQSAERELQNAIKQARYSCIFLVA
ncbi:Tetratricopeptide-like helical [Corchorus capsularis]|uniref:Tetratricopeptide-like helical n=1 Tax=Corchorus capsularis TaxID=210143 RepID=A0A1R3JXK3_COCAP|nr:Tetratricopeptide-like helical [Corchorus capsularis]